MMALYAAVLTGGRSHNREESLLSGGRGQQHGLGAKELRFTSGLSLAM